MYTQTKKVMLVLALLFGLANATQAANTKDEPVNPFRCDAPLVQGGDFHNCDLHGRQVPDGTNLSGINLRSANLTGASLRGVSFVLAHLEGANLNGANISGASLREAYLDNAQFESAIGINFLEPNSTFAYANSVKGINLSNNKLGAYDLLARPGAPADYTGAKFNNCIIDEISLSNAILTNATFLYSRVDSVNFSNSNLTDTDFGWTHFYGSANFSGANTTRTSFQFAGLNEGLIGLDDLNPGSNKPDFRCAVWKNGKHCSCESPRGLCVGR